jgi:hypothetical protein
VSNVKAVLAYLWPTARTDESNQLHGYARHAQSLKKGALKELSQFAVRKLQA